MRRSSRCNVWYLSCWVGEVKLLLHKSWPKSCRSQSGPALAPQRARVDGTLVKAIDRAHRWQGMLESGAFATVEELARAERINSSYLARVLRHSLAWLHGLGAFSVVGSVS